MKLKVKNLNWLAGRPVAILNDKTAEKMNIFVDDRISILSKKKIYAVVDIFSRIVGKKEIGLSFELSRILKSKKIIHTRKICKKYMCIKLRKTNMPTKA